MNAVLHEERLLDYKCFHAESTFGKRAGEGSKANDMSRRKAKQHRLVA